MTQRDTVLKMLDQACVDRRGVTNGQFAEAGILRYSARIDELRKAGHRISKRRLSAGGWLYTLHLDVERIASDTGFVDPAGTGLITRVRADDSLGAETLFEVEAPRPHSPYEEAA